MSRELCQLNGRTCSVSWQLQQDLNFCEGQPLQRSVFKNLLVSAGNYEYSRLSFHPVWSVLSLNNNISSYLMNCQPSPEEDTLMSGESCPMLIYLSQEHRSDNDLFSSVCLICVCQATSWALQGDLHEKGGTRMVTESHSSLLRELRTKVDWMSTQRVLKGRRKWRSRKGRKGRETRAGAPAQIGGEALRWASPCQGFSLE